MDKNTIETLIKQLFAGTLGRVQGEGAVLRLVDDYLASVKGE